MLAPVTEQVVGKEYPRPWHSNSVPACGQHVGSATLLPRHTMRVPCTDILGMDAGRLDDHHTAIAQAAVQNGSPHQGGSPFW